MVEYTDTTNDSYLTFSDSATLTAPSRVATHGIGHNRRHLPKTYSGSFSVRWTATPNWQQRFVGDLMGLPQRTIHDGIQYTNPHEFIQTLIHAVQHDGGHRRDYTLYAGRVAHYWLSSKDYSMTGWLETAVVSNRDVSIRGIDVVKDRQLVPPEVVILMDDTKVRYNSVLDHPVAIGVNVGASTRVRLHMDGDGGCDPECYGKTPLPEDGDHPWMGANPSIPRIPWKSDLYDESDEPSPTPMRLGETTPDAGDALDALRYHGGDRGAVSSPHRANTQPLSARMTEVYQSMQQTSVRDRVALANATAAEDVLDDEMYSYVNMPWTYENDD